MKSLFQFCFGFVKAKESFSLGTWHGKRVPKAKISGLLSLLIRWYQRHKLVSFDTGEGLGRHQQVRALGAARAWQRLGETRDEKMQLWFSKGRKRCVCNCRQR